MKRFHQIIACLFAILIASPVVCCGAHLGSDVSSGCHSGAAKSCCQTETTGDSEKSLPVDHSCGCQAQSPRETKSSPNLLVAPSFDRLPPMLSVGILPALRPSLTADSVVAEDSYDRRPPRLRLALLQRFRI